MTAPVAPTVEAILGAAEAVTGVVATMDSDLGANDTSTLTWAPGQPLPPIYMKRPEEMLRPWLLNPHFNEILVIHSLALILGFLGNATVIIVVVGDRKTRSNTNMFLVSLAAADLLLVMVCAPLKTLQYLVIQWDARGTVCKMAEFAELLSAFASVFNLSAVTVERFVVIVYPMKSRTICTMSNCRRCVCFVWMASIILATPAFLTKDTYPATYTNYISSVTIYYCTDAVDAPIFAIYQLVALFILPGALMLVCYTWVIWELWRSARRMGALTNQNGHGGMVGPRRTIRRNQSRHEMPTVSEERPTQLTSIPDDGSVLDACNGAEASTMTSSGRYQTALQSRRPTQRRDRDHMRDPRKARIQVIKMLILVVILFTVCWGPRIVLDVFIKVGLDNSSFNNAVYSTRVAINALPFLHACVNPIIYSLMSHNLRRAAINRCCCKRALNKRERAQSRRFDPATQTHSQCCHSSVSRYANTNFNG